MRRNLGGSGAIFPVVLAWLVLSSAQATRQDAASQFFERMDSNSDGQIDESEASDWISTAIGGAEFSTKQEVDAAVKQMRVNLDGSDAISEGQLQGHLERLQEVQCLAGLWFFWCLNTSWSAGLSHQAEDFSHTVHCAADGTAVGVRSECAVPLVTRANCQAASWCDCFCAFSTISAGPRPPN